MQPGEERHAALLLSGLIRYRPVRVGTAIVWEEITADKEETLSYELTAVLFADGTFYGPDDILADFSKQIDTARSMARDTQNLEDKYTALKQHEFLKAMRRVNASTDIEALVHRSDVATQSCASGMPWGSRRQKQHSQGSPRCRTFGGWHKCTTSLVRTDWTWKRSAPGCGA